MTVTEIIQLNKANCCGCYGCQNACPTNAISFEPDEEGFWYPRIDEALCVQCGKCIEVCPCRNKPEVLPVKQTLACNAKDKQELMSSSSGGIFAVLARAVLKKGGYVCGAAFDDNFSVSHRIIDSESSLGELKGTKYVQSRIGSVYAEIKMLLEQQKTVLFSGTPCQVAGLKTYLNKDYDNLISVDLICHGVPSPMIWQKYLSEISGGRKIIGINFRNKENGISAATMDIGFDNGEIKQCRYAEDPYIRGFLNNYYVRPSCFECKFKGLKRCSDITIGDFWAVKEFYPDFDSDYGTSAVILRTEKAGKLLSEIKNEVNMIPVKGEQLSVWNENLLKPISKTSNRDAFYIKVKNKSVSDAVAELYRQEQSSINKDSFTQRFKRRIKKAFLK